MAATQHILGHRQGNLVKFKLRRKKGDLSDSAFAVGAEWAGLIISETADLLGFYHIPDGSFQLR